MYLSMWILADWLKKYDPVVKVHNGSCCLKHVRILSDWTFKKERTLYVAATKDFITTAEQGVICVHDKDYLLLHTEDMNAVLNAILDAFDYYNEWERKTQEIIDRNGSLQQMVELAAPIMKNPVLVVNSSHMVQAVTPLSEIRDPGKKYHLDILYSNDSLSLEIARQYNEKLKPLMRKKSPFLYDNTEHLGCMCLQQNLFLKNEHIGWLILLLCHTDATKGIEDLCREFARKLILWVSKQEDRTDLIPQASIFFRLLEQAPMEEKYVREELARLDWREEDTKYLLKIETPPEEKYLWRMIAAHMTGEFSGCYSFAYNEALVVISNERMYPLDRILSELERIFEETEVVIGVSYPFRDVLKLTEFFAQTEIAVKWGKKNQERISYCTDHILDYARELILKNEPISLIHPVIDQIHQYDLEHNTEYLRTLAIYLEEERNQGITAGRLHIHKNTLIYRVNRMEEMFHLDLDQSVQRRQLMLSLLLFFGTI